MGDRDKPWENMWGVRLEGDDTLNENDDSFIVDDLTDDMEIAEVWCYPQNAHLVAAAPALYRAVVALIGDTPEAGKPGHVDFADAIKMGKIALAKASGDLRARGEA